MHSATVTSRLADKAKSILADSSGRQVAFGAGSTAEAHRFVTWEVDGVEVEEE